MKAISAVRLPPALVSAADEQRHGDICAGLAPNRSRSPDFDDDGDS
jgi:hypothetical protein